MSRSTHLGRRSRNLNAAVRTSASMLAVVALIASTVTAVIGGSLYVSDRQAYMLEIRDKARLMRMTRQAIMQVDADALSAFATPNQKPDMVDYGRAVANLESFGLTHLPAKISRGAVEVPATAALASLREAWDDIVAHLDDGDVDAARGIFQMSGVERDIKGFIKAFSTTLDGYEAEYIAVQKTIDQVIWALLFGQVLVGVVSIVAFLTAARKGAREGAARALAVETADAARDQVTRLFKMTDMLQSAADHSDANAVLRATATELLPDCAGALYVFNNSRDRLILATHWGEADGELADTISIQQCWALKRGKPHVSKIDGGALCCEHHSGSDPALEIPMIARGEILGLLRFTATGVDAEERLAAAGGVGAALADAMSLTLSNLGLRDKLRGQALRDPLTGLYNRRYMEDTLARVVRLAERERRDVSVIMIDLDHFKRLNDTHGHARGDAALRDVSALIVGSLRESDVACRYGGEELLVILPYCPIDMAITKAQRLRAAIEGLSEPGGAVITASFGVAAIPTTSGNVSDLMAAADAALYQAKREGRNRVVRAPAIGGPKEITDATFKDALDAAE